VVVDAGVAEIDERQPLEPAGGDGGLDAPGGHVVE
jgi:hypothetical protein